MTKHLQNGPGLTTDTDWDKTWVSVFDHYQNDRRHAYYVNAMRRDDEQSLLEIAAGSFRDVEALCQLGTDCSGMDYSREAVLRARKTYPALQKKFHQMDAFTLKFSDAAFDLSYHNGFWGLFPQQEILALAREQARVSKKRMIATVHNAHNKAFQDYFLNVAQTDPLFRIRFFDVDEIAAIMETVCKNVRVIPVGKGKKNHEDELINRGKTDRRLMGRYLRMSGHRLLERSERLLCIGEL